MQPQDVNDDDVEVEEKDEELILSGRWTAETQ